MGPSSRPFRSIKYSGKSAPDLLRCTPGPVPAWDKEPGADRRSPGAAGRGSGDEAARPALQVPPSQPPGAAAAGPLGLGWGEAGVPGEGSPPPGSTNFSASSSSILLLFFSLKERENKRRVSITLHIGRRERMRGRRDRAGGG